MAKKTQVAQPVQDETSALRNRLEETEETLRAIRQYMVDAFVVTRSNGVQVVTLTDAEFPYRMMVESMNEGAVTVIQDGTIFYCNPRFGEMVHRETESLIGIRFQDLLPPEEQSTFETLFSQARTQDSRGEFHLKSVHGDYLPVQLSIYELAAGEVGGISIIATDIRERVQAEQKIRSLASQLTVAEQEERQRISQILHDDLQQRLFAIKTQLVFLMSEEVKDKVSPTVREEFKQIQRWLSDAIGITRSLSIDLSPVLLQGEGLADAILWLASQMKEQHGLHAQVEAKDNLENVDKQMRLLLFQTVRELLFNIVKHAGTSEATITLSQENERAQIIVGDEGIGFDVGAIMSDQKAAHGLLMVQDRLGLLGCSMEIMSEPGKGTRIRLEAPMTASSA